MAQTDLFPYYKFPKFLKQANVKIDKYIDIIDNDIKTRKKFDLIVPSAMFADFYHCQEIVTRDKFKTKARPIRTLLKAF